jgi:predicted dinucleotide-binding enzyme
MDIGIIGTGPAARALGAAWTAQGHQVAFTGRSAPRAREAARAAGDRATAVGLEAIGRGRDAVLLAVAWDGVEALLAGSAVDDGTPLIDMTNAIDWTIGAHRVAPPGSAAQRIAALAPGARVVKALHLWPVGDWTGAVVPICGDDDRALATVSALVADLGASAVVVGPLARARQAEEAVGLLAAIAAGGADPGAAVPHLPPR